MTVGPAAGRVLSKRFWGDGAATWVPDLHDMLTAGEIGHTVVGVLGLRRLPSLVRALVPWCPRRGHWRDVWRL